MSKRKRDPTFAASEKLALLELIEKHFNIVESKKTDSVSIKEKNEHWKKIAVEFNAVSSIHPRDWVVLKNCWENLKKRATQTQTSRNQHFLGTGGGPPKKLIEDQATERVLELIQNRVTGYINCYDSDGTHVLASSSNATQEVKLCTDNIHIGGTLDINDDQTIEKVTVETNIVDWSEYTPVMLREPRNPALARSPSPSPPEVQLCVAQVEPHQAPNTPPRAQTAYVEPVPTTVTTSRRRPILRRERDIPNLSTECIKTLLQATNHAKEEHDLQMNILKLQEQKEQEVLEQEKLRTLQEKEKLQQEKLKTLQEEIKLEILRKEIKK